MTSRPCGIVIVWSAAAAVLLYCARIKRRRLLASFTASCTAENIHMMRPIFQTHGYVIVRGFLDAEAVDDARAEIGRIVSEPLLPSANYNFDDVAVPATLKQMQHVHKFSDHFAQLVAGKFTRAAEAVLGERALAQNLQYFSKPPTDAYLPSAHLQSSQDTPPHQDGYYFCFADGGGSGSGDGSCSEHNGSSAAQAVTMWVALDHVDAENGCLRYVRGSAKGPLRQHDFSNVVGFSQQIVGYDPQAEVRRRRTCFRGL